MSLSSMKSIEQIIFKLESGNKNVDRQTDGLTNRQKTDRQNYTNFKRKLAMMVSMSLSSLNSIGQTVFELESRNEQVDGQTDGQKKRQKMDKRTNK